MRLCRRRCHSWTTKRDRGGFRRVAQIYASGSCVPRHHRTSNQKRNNKFNNGRMRSLREVLQFSGPGSSIHQRHASMTHLSMMQRAFAAGSLPTTSTFPTLFAVLHAFASRYCPSTRTESQQYAPLASIHKASQNSRFLTCCFWPRCSLGRFRPVCAPAKD